MEQKIRKENFEFVKQSERLHYDLLRQNHLQSEQFMFRMEDSLRQLFEFWEDLMVVPQKFEKNYSALFIITKNILNMKQQLEVFSKRFINSKLFKTFILFADMVGFPAAEIKKSLVKSILSVEEILQRNFVTVKIRNTIVSSRKSAIMIVSAVHEHLGQILYTSSLIQGVTSYHASDLRNKNIRQLMPYCYATEHDKIMENFLTQADERKLKSRNLVVYIADPNGFIHKVGLFLKIYPFCDDQLKLVNSLDCFHETHQTRSHGGNTSLRQNWPNLRYE